jgi:hypothetical protein
LEAVAQEAPAKKKRFGKDPFTGEDRGSLRSAHPCA